MGERRPARDASRRRRMPALRRALALTATAPSTLRRRMSSWAPLHRWNGLEGPFASPALRSPLRLAVRPTGRPRKRKGRRAATRDVLVRLVATCASDRLADTRDLAILMVAFASGRQRRSEVARLPFEQSAGRAVRSPRTCRSEFDPALFCDPARPHQVDFDRRRAKVLLVGASYAALKEWLEPAGIGRAEFYAPSIVGVPSKIER